jgi:hypothetical protein
MNGGKRLPRRDMVPWHKAGPWFYGAFWFGVLALFAGTAAVAVAGIAVAVPLVVAGIWRYRQAQRNPLASVHRELLDCLRSLPEAGAWLNRDERSAYTYQVKGRKVLMPAVTVVRVPEDDMLAVHSEDQAHLVVDTWQVNPWEYGIQHGIQGTTITGADVDRGVIEFPRTGFRQWLKSQRAARKTGLLYVPADEVRALMKSLRDAEPMSEGKA